MIEAFFEELISLLFVRVCAVPGAILRWSFKKGMSVKYFLSEEENHKSRMVGLLFLIAILPIIVYFAVT